ncbi:hypothetical protein [Streptomyces sp. ISL-94]|uniref:hypothetical protein n=1 Tax=Streptomyces sp. ISL-94 TaxID=2819190 RepID=UPI001BE9638D|nr:hypothetical protein [Streptomyces sp. ISL-94]MBT2478159.1 hypothetical protein [Streptomyces sp. ISL-94]
MLILISIGSLAALGWLRYGLLPLRPLNTRLPGPDPLLQRTLKDVSHGEWTSAAQLLTDAGKDWDRRAYYVQHLSHSAAHDGDAWLRAWNAARPEDSDAALVSACARVEHAWKTRGALRASATSSEQFEAFHRELLGARDDLARVAAMNPEDPTPLAKEIWVALGLGYPMDTMRSLWDQVTERAPHVYSAHHGALQFMCKKWRGSHIQAKEFATQAAHDAPLGSLLKVLPLNAWYEEHEVFTEERLMPESFRSPHLIGLVNAALEDAAAAEGHPELPVARHVLAYFLLRQGRYRESVAQFRHVDGYAHGLPWRYQPLPRLSYRSHRTRAMWGALLLRR